MTLWKMTAITFCKVKLSYCNFLRSDPKDGMKLKSAKTRPCHNKLCFFFQRQTKGGVYKSRNELSAGFLTSPWWPMVCIGTPLLLSAGRRHERWIWYQSGSHWSPFPLQHLASALNCASLGQNSFFKIYIQIWMLEFAGQIFKLSGLGEKRSTWARMSCTQFWERGKTLKL